MEGNEKTSKSHEAPQKSHAKSHGRSSLVRASQFNAWIPKRSGRQRARSCASYAIPTQRTPRLFTIAELAGFAYPDRALGASPERKSSRPNNGGQIAAKFTGAETPAAGGSSQSLSGSAPASVGVPYRGNC